MDAYEKDYSVEHPKIYCASPLCPGRHYLVPMHEIESGEELHDECRDLGESKIESSEDFANQLFHVYFKQEIEPNQLAYMKLDAEAFVIFPQFTVEDIVAELGRLAESHGYSYAFSHYPQTGKNLNGEDANFHIIEWRRINAEA